MPTTASIPTGGPGSATSDGSTETGTDSDSDSDSDGPECDGIELAQDGVLDSRYHKAIDYVVITGSIYLNGEPLPDAAGPRGQVVFEYEPLIGSPGTASHALASAGPEDYTVVLPASVAQLLYVPDADACAAEPAGPMPCTGGVLITDVELTSSGVLDLDIPAISVAGLMTQNGEPTPAAADLRGHLEFAPSAGDAARTKAFSPAGETSYAATLLPGVYDISFVGNPNLCSAGAAAVPCNRGVLEAGRSLVSSGVLDLDVPRGRGQRRGHGQRSACGRRRREPRRDPFFAPPGAPPDDAAGGLVSAAFTASGPAEYAVSLVAGDYDASSWPRIQVCARTARRRSPCSPGPLLQSVTLTGSGVLDLDIPMIEVSGAVTLSGQPLPDELGDRGALHFARGEEGEPVPVALGVNGPADYSLALIPGAYNISLAANPELCDGATAPQLPCAGGRLAAVELATSGVLDLDLEAVQVTGAFTLNGAPLPSQTGPRGALSFADASGAAVTLPLGESGGYAVTVWPGAYDIVYAPADPCAGPPENHLPCGGGHLLTQVDLVMNGVLDVDIPAVDLSGAVTYEGASLPDLASSRGAIRWRRDDDAAFTVELEQSGPFQYAASIIPGSWVIEHVATPELCADDVPGFPLHRSGHTGLPAALRGEE